MPIQKQYPSIKNESLTEFINKYSEKRMGLFGAAKADPKKQVNEMSQLLRRETRAIERQIRDIERQQQKTTQMLKQNAKKGDKEACRILGQ